MINFTVLPKKTRCDMCLNHMSRKDICLKLSKEHICVTCLSDFPTKISEYKSSTYLSDLEKLNKILENKAKSNAIYNERFKSVKIVCESLRANFLPILTRVAKDNESFIVETGIRSVHEDTRESEKLFEGLYFFGYKKCEESGQNFIMPFFLLCGNYCDWAADRIKQWDIIYAYSGYNIGDNMHPILLRAYNEFDTKYKLREALNRCSNFRWSNLYTMPSSNLEIIETQFTEFLKSTDYTQRWIVK